eukprot:TRINITY_DN13013_c0_g1_i1.p1 TRINITY_DN13013_c0_g1~~TRINITY_DN13013_c0_g1_i1.p1  ORF type:complete len:190 (-),score=15.46 TRINITY_DN13013_c0_g1_i1:343-912(-)
MALPWWRTLTSILSLYDTCAMGDPGTTYECLGALTPLLLTPPAPADPHDGLHHLTWTLREFLTREADTVSSPAGALNANHREAARRSAPSPMEEELDFSKEDSGSVAAGDGDCPGAPGLLSELFRPRGWGPPRHCSPAPWTTSPSTTSFGTWRPTRTSATCPSAPPLSPLTPPVPIHRPLRCSPSGPYR